MVTAHSGFFVSAPSKGDRARRRLLAAAVVIFGRHGPAGATVRAIARAAGQNVAAIAYYFGGKQGLYHAVIEGIVREIRGHLAEVLAQIDSARLRGTLAPAEARRLLKLFLRTIYLRVLSRDQVAPIVQLIVREQLGPTPGFEIFYRQAFRELHEALCFLVGEALGRSPRQRATILRTHMVIGQVYFFAMSREAILRRVGWRTLEGKNAELVVEILDEHIDALLGALAEPPAGRTAARRSP
jgi:TetR/AcrR family transcriptional regulator, regulator of cefoperazone and chloramphenicol sensitivity